MLNSPMFFIIIRPLTHPPPLLGTTTENVLIWSTMCCSGLIRFAVKSISDSKCYISVLIIKNQWLKGSVSRG